MINEISATTGVQRPVACEERLFLWQRLLKLRWLRLDGEAERVVTEINALHCTHPLQLPPRIHSTD
jgi:hypothetical protein